MLWHMARFRLKATKSKEPPRVDAEGHGALRGISVISEGEALGHGFQVDEKLVDQVVEAGNASQRGLSSRWTHGNLCDDGLGKHLGRIRNLRKEVVSGKARAIGDLEFSKLAHSFHPDGHDLSAADLIMQLAEEEPDVLGMSIVADLDIINAEDDVEDMPEDDEDMPEEKEKFTGAKLGRLRKLLRADVVADPAANPEGLFAGSSSELAERATFQMDLIVDRYGSDKVQTFLSRYWTNRGDNPMSEKHLAEVQDLQAQLAARDAQITEMTAALTALQQAEAERKALENEQAIVSLKTKAVELGSPLPEDDVELVREAPSRGDEQTAEILKAAFLSRSEALGRVAQSQVVSLNPGVQAEADLEASINERVARFGLSR